MVTADSIGREYSTSLIIAVNRLFYTVIKRWPNNKIGDILIGHRDGGVGGHAHGLQFGYAYHGHCSENYW